MRLKSAHHTNANVSSSWPTLDASIEKFRLSGNSQQSRSLEAMGRRGELGPPDRDKLNKSGKSQGSWGGQSQKNWQTYALGCNERGSVPSTQVVNALVKGEKPPVQVLTVDQVFAEEIKKSQESWPTPTAMSRPRSEETMEKCLKFRQSKGKNSVPLYLEEKVKKEESWATPRADKYTAENLESWEKRHKEGKVSQQPLPTQVQNWPTPRETMSRDVDHDRGKGNLGEKVQSKGMKLNPDWVEQLMGLPVGWTQLPTAWIG